MWSSRAWISTAAAIAAAIVLVVLFTPGVDAPRTLSAAEILGRSLQTLTPSSGTELLEYDLVLHLPPAMPLESGAYRVVQLIDHDAQGRYRIAKYGSDGTLLAAVSEDAAARRRTAFVRVDGQPYEFNFAIDPSQHVPFRDLERHHVEAVIRLLQSVAGQTVTEADDGGAKRYIVELPHVVNSAAAGLWDLWHARVVVDATDFRIVDLSASGSYLTEPFSVSFRLWRREVRPTEAVPASEFDVPHDPSAIAIEALGSADVARDLLAAALREVGRMRR